MKPIHFMNTMSLRLRSAVRTKMPRQLIFRDTAGTSGNVSFQRAWFCSRNIADEVTRTRIMSKNHHHHHHPRWLSSKRKKNAVNSQSTRPPKLADHVEYEDKTLPRPVLDPADYPHKIPVRMPDMGKGGGKILQWHKKQGDVILREDVLCDIETPDFVFGMETDDEHPAIMGEILVEAPSKEIQDDEIICYLMHPSPGDDDKGNDEE